MNGNPTAWTVAGTLLIYFLFYRGYRVRFVLRAPKQRWNVAVFDIVQLSLPAGLASSLGFGSNVEFFLFGCALEGMIIALLGGIELGALRKFDPGERDEAVVQEDGEKHGE